LTLAAIAGASAVIAGGILAASSATAEPTKAVLGQAAVVAASTVATATETPAPRAPESQPRGAQNFDGTGKFVGTQAEFDSLIRAQLISPYDPNSDKGITTGVLRQDFIAVGPTPCDSCDPLDLTNNASPNYDPTVLAVYAEDDLLPAPDGPGVATCQGLSVTGPFWAGANDQCWGPVGVSGADANNVDRQLPVFNTLGQHYLICGQMGLVNTSGFTGDPNNPGGPLNTEDADIWELHLGTGLDIAVSGYTQATGLRFVMTFNGVLFQDNGQIGQFRDCNDDYYVFNSWSSIGFEPTVACTEDGQWGEFLSAGYYFILMDPRTTAAQGTPGAQLCEYWYNLEIEAIDPDGACCVGDTCTDGVAKTTCFGLGGAFRGATSSCATAICCDVLAELAGELLTADYTEGNTVFNPFTEKKCNVVGSQDTNPGCQRDNQGAPIPGVFDMGEPVANSSSVLLDVCADPNKFVLVGYAGTPDDYEASFLASQFFVFADGDAFVFENYSGDSQALSFDGFSAATGVWQYQVNAASYPDGGAFGYSCDVSGFLDGGGISPPCERVSVADCVADGTTWSFGFRNFEAAGIPCDLPYWFSIDCSTCPKVACCLPNGNCVDGLDANECNNYLNPGAGGVGQGDWSSCCYVTCIDSCDGDPIPSGSVSDDNCDNTNPNTGDLFNSGCDAPDGNPIGKFSSVGFPANQEWCGSTGLFVLTLPSENPKTLHSESDFYLIDLTSASNDVGVRFTITTPSAINFYIVPDRGQGDCPQPGVDGTADVRELDDTSAFGLNGGVTSIINFCLEAGTQNMLLFDVNEIVECGSPYHVQIEYFTDGCKAACCNAYLNQAGSGAQGCTLVADVPNTIPNEALQACSSDALRGTYRGLNTRCTGAEAVTCCNVAQVGGDVPDSDNNTCPATNAANGNRGCIAPAGGAFQALGNFTPGVGPAAGTTVTVWGSVCRQSTPPANPISDNDFYSVNVTSAGGAEYLCTVDSNARIAVFAYNAADLGLPASCNLSNEEREVLFNPTNPCGGPATVAGSGLSAEGNTFCLLGNQLNYFLVQPTVVNDGVEAQYRMTLTAYECRTGACCLDATLCFDSAGFLECEAVNGGQFIAGASCPNDTVGLELCRGVCCVDAGPGPAVCTPDTTAYDCCVLLNCATPANGCSFPFDSGFAGYTAGDLIFTVDCTLNPDICEEGACCVDSISGYTCQDNLSATQCSSLSGLFQGIGSACADVTCPEHPCCLGPTCSEGYSPLECSNVGGTYKPADANCSTVVCTPTGACCFSCAGTVVAPCPDPSGPVVGCTILTAAQCASARGLYVGNNTTCTQGVGGPCDCAGDINGDGNTNTSDFNILAGSFGQGNPNCKTHAQGDLNCDGVVNTSDFNILAGNFGCIRN